MTDPVQPRPQPVVDLASFGANIVVVVGGLAFIVDGIATATHWTWAISCGAGLTGAAAFLAKYVPKLAAIGAAAQVTPLEDPRDHLGNQLEALAYIGKHRAPEGGCIGEGLPEAPALIHPDDRFFSRDQLVRLDTNRTDTQEIPRVTTRRPLGRKPPTNAPRIKLTASMVPAAAFSPPPSVDWYSKVPASSWGADGNDDWGDCTCAEVDHTTKARQVAAGNPEAKSTEDEVLALYSAVTGFDPSVGSPGQNPTDQGAVMQDVRDFWRKNGVILGGRLDKVTLFAQVDHTDLDLIRWCVARFGAVALGINFPASAMDQFDNGQPWDVVKGSPIEGGHAISLVGYDAQYAYVVTWGQVQKMTWAFFEKYVEEAWTDVSTDWINAESGQDPLGEVAYALGEQFAQVTGQPNPFPAPAPTPEPPAPDPGPAPAPVPAPSPLPANVTVWARRVVGELWRSKTDRKIAQEILDYVGQQ